MSSEKILTCMGAQFSFNYVLTIPFVGYLDIYIEAKYLFFEYCDVSDVVGMGLGK